MFQIESTFTKEAEMTWLLAVVAYLIIFAFVQFVLKSTIHALPKAKAMSLQFFICAGLIWVFAWITKAIQFDQFFLLISAVGFINAFGAYCQWRALEFSLSKTSLFNPLVSITAIGLAAIFLGEALIYKNPWLIPGVILLFFAAFLLSKKQKEREENPGIKWLMFVLGMILIAGGAVFMVKFFSFDVPRTTFLSYWYAGAFLGSLPVLLFERKDKTKLFQKAAWRVPLLSFGILGAMAILYWAFQLAPAGIILPISTFGTAFLPLLIGWLVFKERGGLAKNQIIGFVLGIIGVVLIVISQII